MARKGSLRGRLVAYLSEHGGWEGSQKALADELGAVPSRLRVVVQELRDEGVIAVGKNVITAPTTTEDERKTRDEIRAAVEELARKPVELPAGDVEELARLVPKGGPLDLAEVVEEGIKRYSPDTAEIHPSEVARELGVSRETVRKVLAEMVESDELKSDGAGGYTRANPEGEASDAAEVEQWIRDTAATAGKDKFRVFTDKGGTEVITQHSPKGKIKARTIPMPAPSTPTPQSLGAAAAPQWGGRKIKLSDDPPVRMPFLWTPLDVLEVIDLDGDKAREVPDEIPGLVGVSITPHGLHYYRMPGHPPLAQQDQDFAEWSRRRGAWSERLFNRDGTPRPVPIAWPPHRPPHPAMRDHIDAWTAAQAKCRAEGLHVGKPMLDKGEKR